MESLKVMLHGTIRNDNFLRNTTLQYWNNVETIRNNDATLCCAKNRPSESSRLTSLLRSGQDAGLRSGTISKDLPVGRTHASLY